MKWKNTPPKIGDERIVKKFLLFPKTLQNETRWLEIVFIRQERVYQFYAIQLNPQRWKAIAWSNAKQYKSYLKHNHH